MENSSATITTQIAEARARIAEILLEIDNITLQLNPQIEAEYATKIGYLENDLLKWQIAARRSRRRCQLAQARINAGLNFAEDQFEEQLDSELEEWDSLLAQNVQAFLRTVEKRSGRQAMSPIDAQELKTLHKQLIKRLHPDLHPGQPEETTRFFMVAQSAYEQGDLYTLRSIAVATEGMGQPDNQSTLTEDEATVELEMVLAQERVTNSQLEALKRSNPYALKARLEDGTWVISRTTELKQQIEQQKEAAKSYDQRFKQLSRRS